MSLVDEIKKAAKSSGTNKGKFLYFKAGAKVRIRFLEDMEDGKKVTFHDSFQAGINVPCQEEFGRDCPYCDDDELRTRDMYAWSVWDYDAKEVKVLMFAVNQCSPVPSLVALYETYGTLTDRDFVISKSGQAQSTSYSVIPMDKNKFKNDKAKPLSKKKFLEYLDAAFPADNDDKPKKNKKVEDDDDDWADDEVDYESMSAKELYQLCKEREIDAKPKKSADYYIDLLEGSDDNEEDEEDEWDN